MSEITIYAQAQPLEVKEYNGQRVVTFKDIDTLHQRPDGTARRNFNENKERFIEGEDYFTVALTADEIRTQFGAGKNAGRTVNVVTQFGYLMLVKSFNDDLAWHIQRQLVSNYFHSKTQSPPLNANPQLDRLITLLEQQYTVPSEPSLSVLPELEASTEEKSAIAQLKKKKLLNRREAATYIGVGLSTFTDIVNQTNFYPLLRIGHNRGKVYVNREKLDQWISEQDASIKVLRA